MKDKRENALSARDADEKSILSLCRGIHDLLYHYKPAEWSDKKALAIVDEVGLFSLPQIHTLLAQQKTHILSAFHHQPGGKGNGRQSNAPRDLEHGKGSCLYQIAGLDDVWRP